MVNIFERCGVLCWLSVLIWKPAMWSSMGNIPHERQQKLIWPFHLSLLFYTSFRVSHSKYDSLWKTRNSRTVSALLHMVLWCSQAHAEKKYRQEMKDIVNKELGSSMYRPIKFMIYQCVNKIMLLKIWQNIRHPKYYPGAVTRETNRQ